MSSFIRIYEKNETKFNHNGLKTLHPTSCKITRNLYDYTYELDMEHPIDDSNAWKEIIEGRIIKANGQYFRIFYTTTSIIDNSLTVYAKHIFFDLQNNFIEDADVIAKNGNTSLGQLLGSTAFKHNFTSYSDISGVNNLRCIRKNTLDALLGESESFISYWGGEFDADNFNIKIVNQIGKDNGYTILYGKNLTGLKLEVDYTEIVTRIRPIGFDEIELSDDNKYVDSPHINDYAMPIIKEYKYENVKWTGSPNYEADKDDTARIFNTLEEAQNELRRLANLEFANSEVDLPKITCEINFIELSQTEEYKDIKFLETVSLGDVVTIYHKPLGINIKARCIAYVYDCLLDKYESITIGSYQKNFFKETTKTNEKLENNDFDISEQFQSVYAQSISKMTDMMNNAMNGYVVLSNSEVLIMDSPNKLEAKNIWRFNSSGIAHSSSGYNGEYTVGMTMDGRINGALITAGTIKGDMLEASTITTRELAVEIQTTIATAMTEERTQAMITANLNTFESNLSQTYITQNEASKQIQSATEVAVEEATQEIVNTSVERAMASVNDQLDNKLSEYTTDTLNPVLQDAINETLQDSKDYTVEVIGGYYTKEETDSKISQTREEIELGISNTYETKENTTIKIEGTVGNAIKEMSIGAVNRVFGSNTEKSIDFIGFYNQNWYPYDVSSDISDKEVTISFEYDLNASVGIDSQLLFQPRYLNSLNEEIYSPSRKILSFSEPQEVILTNQQVSFILTFTDVKQDFSFGIRADGITGSLTIRKAQIKEGNKITEWSIAPEDIVNNAQAYTIEQLKNYYTKEQTSSMINASKDEINLSVSETYETKAEVDTKINQIQIGGANLILNSDFRNGITNWAYTSAWKIHKTEKYKDKNIIYVSRTGLTSDVWSELRSNKINVKKDMVLTMSVDIKWQDIPDGEGCIIGIWGYDSNNENRKSLKEKTIKGSQDWNKIILVGTVPAGVAYVRAIITHRRNGSIYATNFKLETGNKATDWSPAPEDIISEAKDFTTTELKNAFDEAKDFTTTEADKALTESKEYTDRLITNYYDKQETLAQINIAKESIESTVKSSYVSKSEIDGMVIGGDNLIPNSNFAFQLQNWSLHTPPNVDDSTSSVLVVKSGEYVDEAVNTLQIRANNLVDRYGVSTETLNLSANTEYVLSGYCAGLRVESLQTNIRDAENNLVNISTQDYLPVVGKDLSEYHYFIHKFKTVESTKYRINLYGKNFGEDGYAWFTNVKLQQGNTPTAWTGCEQDYKMYAHQTMSQVSFELADLSQIVASNTGSDSITSAMKVKLMSEYNDAITLFNRLNSVYSTFGDTSFNGLLLELTTARDELISAVAPLEESIGTASEWGLNNILTKFNNFYALTEELTLAIQNSLAGLAKETRTQVTQLADSYNISISKVEHIGQQVDELTTHFNFTSDGLVIKSSEDATKTVKLDNDSLDFLDNNTVVAQITDKQLLIRDAKVENELKIGSFKIKPSGTGGIVFIYE